MWDASLKRQNNPPSASAAYEAFGCRCPVFLVLAPACTAVRFGLPLSTLSRLTHILYAVFRRIKLICSIRSIWLQIGFPWSGWRRLQPTLSSSRLLHGLRRSRSRPFLVGARLDPCRRRDLFSRRWRRGVCLADRLDGSPAGALFRSYRFSYRLNDPLRCNYLVHQRSPHRRSTSRQPPVRLEPLDGPRCGVCVPVLVQASRSRGPRMPRRNGDRPFSAAAEPLPPDGPASLVSLVSLWHLPHVGAR